MSEQAKVPGAPSPLNPRLDEQCAYVHKWRSSEHFEPYCYVHRHWLNGELSGTCADRLVRLCPPGASK